MYKVLGMGAVALISWLIFEKDKNKKKTTKAKKKTKVKRRKKMYRTKTYVAFDGKEDIMSYRNMQGWNSDESTSFDFSDAHEVNTARDDSLPESIIRQLKERLDTSKHIILIIGDKIKYNRKGIIEYEINYALRNKLPIILVYKGYSSTDRVTNDTWQSTLSKKLPSSLKNYTGDKFCLISPFTREVIEKAKNNFSHKNLPNKGYNWHWN